MTTETLERVTEVVSESEELPWYDEVLSLRSTAMNYIERTTGGRDFSQLYPNERNAIRAKISYTISAVNEVIGGQGMTVYDDMPPEKRRQISAAAAPWGVYQMEVVRQLDEADANWQEYHAEAIRKFS